MCSNSGRIVNFYKFIFDEVDCVDGVAQLYAGILLGVMGTDVPISDFLDAIPEYKVSLLTTNST